MTEAFIVVRSAEADTSGAYVLAFMAAVVARNHWVVTVEGSMPECLVAHHGTAEQGGVVDVFGDVLATVGHVLDLP